MKKILLTLVAVLAVALGASADTYTIDRDRLPEQAREFLDKHFPKSKVGMIKVDRHLFKKTDYDVRLVNGTKLEFNPSGAWTEVDCKTREVPSSIVMKPIRTYVAKNYPDVKIVKIEKKSTSFKVKLSDGVELTFSRLGQFRKVELDDD